MLKAWDAYFAALVLRYRTDREQVLQEATSAASLLLTTKQVLSQCLIDERMPGPLLMCQGMGHSTHNSAKVKPSLTLARTLPLLPLPLLPPK